MLEIETIQDTIKRTQLFDNLQQRDGMDKFVEYLLTSDFLKSPASTKYHGAYEGGLAAHSYNVYTLFKRFVEEFNLNIDESSIFICAFGHDLCKVGAYLGDSSPYTYNSNHPKGHAKHSLKILSLFFDLTETEKQMSYH